jgi:hypothetical protein
MKMASTLRLPVPITSSGISSGGGRLGSEVAERRLVRERGAARRHATRT